MSDSDRTVHAEDAISLEVAQMALKAAVEKARELGLRVSVALLDGGGHLLAFARMDEIHAGTVEVSIAKARCAAMFKRSTKSFAEAYANGATSLVALPGVLPFEGGVPIIAGKRLLGAFGCSGASPAADEAVAEAGVAAALSHLEEAHG